jgi:hypothetical protein
MTHPSRLLQVTQANLDYRHLYVTEAQDFFPSDVFGGANKTEAAPRTVRLLFGSEAVDTDIDQTKNIFRRRSWVGRFFDANRVRAGDRIRLEQLEPYVYRVSKV